MDEFPAVQSVVKSTLALAGKAQRIKRLKVIVGERSGLSLQGLREHFKPAALGTPAENAVLELFEEKCIAQCAECETDFKPHKLTLACPFCGSTQLNYIAGNQIKIAAVEVEP